MYWAEFKKFGPPLRKLFTHLVTGLVIIRYDLILCLFLHILKMLHGFDTTQFHFGLQ